MLKAIALMAVICIGVSAGMLIVAIIVGIAIRNGSD
jgi:hypothetical protein